MWSLFFYQVLVEEKQTRQQLSLICSTVRGSDGWRQRRLWIPHASLYCKATHLQKCTLIRELGSLQENNIKSTAVKLNLILVLLHLCLCLALLLSEDLPWAGAQQCVGGLGNLWLPSVWPRLWALQGPDCHCYPGRWEGQSSWEVSEVPATL